MRRKRNSVLMLTLAFGLVSLLGCKSELEQETAAMAKAATKVTDWEDKLKTLRKKGSPLHKRAIISTFGKPFKVEKTKEGLEKLIYPVSHPSVDEGCITTATFTLSDGTQKKQLSVQGGLQVLPKDTVYSSFGPRKPSPSGKNCRAR